MSRGQGLYFFQIFASIDFRSCFLFWIYFNYQTKEILTWAMWTRCNWHHQTSAEFSFSSTWLNCSVIMGILWKRKLNYTSFKFGSFYLFLNIRKFLSRSCSPAKCIKNVQKGHSHIDENYQGEQWIWKLEYKNSSWKIRLCHLISEDEDHHCW